MCTSVKNKSDSKPAQPAPTVCKVITIKTIIEEYYYGITHTTTRHQKQNQKPPSR